MQYKSITVSSKSSIKRFTHSKRFILIANLLKKNKYKKILDYGAGDGELYKFLDLKTRKKIFFFEPKLAMVKEMKKNLKNYEKIKIFTNSNRIFKNYFDLICINEVFEHLNLKEQKKLINNLKKILKQNGIIIISVPIEVGLSSLIKNFIRIIIFQTHENTTFFNIIKSLFYLEINRPNKKYNNSHIGFNYLKFVKFLKKENLIIDKYQFSPFNFLKGFINSQIFITAKFK